MTPLNISSLIFRTWDDIFRHSSPFLHGISTPLSNYPSPHPFIPNHHVYHGQVIDCAWIAEDAHQAWGYSAYKHDDTAKEGMPASLYDFSPMLLGAACQLVGFLINTSAYRQAGENFVTDELGECSIAIQKLYETKYIETYASYRLVDNGTAALGQVFTVDDQGQIITAFRDVRMARMKLHVLKRLIDRILKPKQQVVTSQAVVDVQEYDVAADDFDEKAISILQSALRVAELPRDKPVSNFFSTYS